MDAQQIDAAWLFPTLGVMYEEALKQDPEAVGIAFRAFNRWLDEDWGLHYGGRILAAPYISLADVHWAVAELGWAIDRGARVVCVRPVAPTCADGSRSPGDPRFDPFWALANEAGITIAVHGGETGYSSHGYAPDGMEVFADRLSPLKLLLDEVNIERPIMDYLAAMICDRVFERFPNLRMASIENGSGYLSGLFARLRGLDRKLPGHFSQDPVETFRRHIWISPFWEERIEDVIELVGPDRVLFGSDWPHVEGLPQPIDVPRRDTTPLTTVFAVNWCMTMHTPSAPYARRRCSATSMTTRSDAPSGRAPCIVGVGQVLSHSSDPRDTEPLELWARACSLALADARSARGVRTVDSVAVVRCDSWSYDAPAQRLADAARPLTGPSWTDSPLGGCQPQHLLHTLCDDIAAGRMDLGLVVSGEALYTLDVVTRAGEEPGWGHRAAAPPPVDLGDFFHESEVRHGMLPIMRSFALRDVGAAGTARGRPRVLRPRAGDHVCGHVRSGGGEPVRVASIGQRRRRDPRGQCGQSDARTPLPQTHDGVAQGEPGRRGARRRPGHGR